MQITKKYSLVRIALIVVELFQENNQFWRVFGSWLVFYSIRECTRELAPTFVLVNIQTKTTSDFNAMNLLRGKQASIWNLSKHPNQKQRAISRRWIYCGRGKQSKHPNQKQEAISTRWIYRGEANTNHSKHPKIKNNKRIQRAPIISSIKTRMNWMNE